MLLFQCAARASREPSSRCPRSCASKGWGQSPRATPHQGPARLDIRRYTLSPSHNADEVELPPPTTRMMPWPTVSVKTRPQWGRACFADALLPARPFRGPPASPVTGDALPRSVEIESSWRVPRPRQFSDRDVNHPRERACAESEKQDVTRKESARDRCPMLPSPRVTFGPKTTAGITRRR